MCSCGCGVSVDESAGVGYVLAHIRHRDGYPPLTNIFCVGWWDGLIFLSMVTWS